MKPGRALYLEVYTCSAATVTQFDTVIMVQASNPYRHGVGADMVRRDFRTPPYSSGGSPLRSRFALQCPHKLKNLKIPRDLPPPPHTHTHTLHCRDSMMPQTAFDNGCPTTLGNAKTASYARILLRDAFTFPFAIVEARRAVPSGAADQFRITWRVTEAGAA